MEERLMKKFHADEEEEDYMLLMSLLPYIKKLEDIQRLELKMDF